MPNTKKRILHVDDEIDTLKVVKTILEKEGFEVVSSTSGEDALKQVDINDFELLILDIMMPDMSGWELFTRVSKLKEAYKVIFLSVLEVSEERLEGLKAYGIKDYILKPFDRDDLVERVRRVTGES